MRIRFPILIVLVATLIGGGCATQQDDLLAKLLRDIDTAEPGAATGTVGYGDPDVPDAPDHGLPPLGAATAGYAGGRRGVSGSGESFGPGELTIQPDCIVQIRVEEDPGLNGSYPVNKIGAVNLGYIGPVILYNRTEEQSAAKIQEVLTSRHFRKATVKVKILRASYDKVQVGGAVLRPNLIHIGAGDSISLNDALLRAGGLKPSARGARVKIVRDGLLSAVAMALPGEEHALVNEAGVPVVPNVRLDNNDVAYVFSGVEEAPLRMGDKHILVLGEVKRRGIYRFAATEPCTMMHLIFKMGGLPAYADDRAVRIIRRDEEGLEHETPVSVRAILKRGDPEDDFPLEDGDRILVPSRVIRLF